MTEDNPITETCLEHFLLLCMQYKDMEKTIDDVIENIKTKLKIIKHKKFEQIESELTR